MKLNMKTALGVVSTCLMMAGTAMATPSGSPSAGAHRTLATISNGDGKTISGALVVLRAHPGTQADRIARQLMEQQVLKDSQFGEMPMVLVATARLGNSHNSTVLFVQIQSPRDCGSAGCDMVSFRHANGRWVRILDTVSGTIRVAKTRHKGMRDLIVQDTNLRIWDGEKYANTVPTPPSDLDPPAVSPDESQFVVGRWT